MERAQERTAIVVAGSGAPCDRWAAAFRSVEGVDVQRLRGTHEDDLLASLSRPGVAAAAFVAPMPELTAAVKRSLMARRHVFVAEDVALTSKQLRSIDALARRRERAIVFDAAAVDTHLAFVRKMTSGSAAIWRPHYIRSLRTGAIEGETLDELAIAECARLLAVVDDTPGEVRAFAPRIDDESGRCDAAMIMLSFDGGVIAQLDISMVEPSPRREMVIACEGRTIVVDAFEAGAPLRIDAAARHGGPRRDGQWAETISEHPMAEEADRSNTSAANFIATVRGRAFAKASNALRLAAAARVWEAARESISQGGDRIYISDDTSIQRPRFRLIEGGGRGGGPQDAPELTVVARS
jgi:hypothetical protein